MAQLNTQMNAPSAKVVKKGPELTKKLREYRRAWQEVPTIRYCLAEVPC